MYMLRDILSMSELDEALAMVWTTGAVGTTLMLASIVHYRIICCVNASKIGNILTLASFVLSEHTFTDLRNSISLGNLSSGRMPTFTAAPFFNLCNIVGGVTAGIVRNRDRCVADSRPCRIVQTVYRIKSISCAIIESAFDETVMNVNEQIKKLGKTGLTPSKIGIILRDSHGVAQVRFVNGNKILRIMKSVGLKPGIPEDVYHMIKKAVAIRKHLERNRKDKDGKFRLILVESRIQNAKRSSSELEIRIEHNLCVGRSLSSFCSLRDCITFSNIFLGKELILTNTSPIWIII
ncbi:hypothetical protein GQX74_003880 [Glossina fuscipes]|nr:hypothetical protein GQX74_003880 [Glossina fuscipes]